MKIEVKAYDRRTEIMIDRHLPVGLIQIRQILEESYIKGNISYVDEIEGINVFKIDNRLIVKQIATINKRIHELAGVQIAKPKKQQKKCLEYDNSIIVGFKGILGYNYEWIYKQI